MKEKTKSDKKKIKPRLLFTDNWNSFWHIILGVFAVKIKFLVPIFIWYQLLDQKDVNVFIDILEFTYGYIFGIMFLLI